MVWHDHGGYLRHRGVTVHFDVPPPVETLREAHMVRYMPGLEDTRAIVGGVLRSLTDDECIQLHRFAEDISSAALKALDAAYERSPKTRKTVSRSVPTSSSVAGNSSNDIGRVG